MRSFDVIVIGAGLSGMFAGALAARSGARTLVIARGNGGTHVSTGCVNIAGYGKAGLPVKDHQYGRGYPAPVERWETGEENSGGPALPEGGGTGWQELRKNGHPYSRVEREELEQAVNTFAEICERAGYPMQVRPGENFILPTSAGAVRAAAMVPDTMANGDLRQPGDILLVSFPGFRDFFPAFAAANLSLRPGTRARAMELPLPDAPARREAYATDLALLFDDADYRSRISKLWKPLLSESKGGEGRSNVRVGFPAVLGIRHAAAARRHLADRLEVELFEIPILPPSVPGIRLFNILRDELKANGGELILGPRVIGRVDGRSAGRRVAGVMAESAGGQRAMNAGVVVLACGGFLHGGLEAREDGRLVESVFNLPVNSGEAQVRAPAARTPESRAADLYLSPQPYTRAGLRVNERSQPVDVFGEQLYENLYAVGGVLAGADRTSEGSREGIDLGTAWKAIHSIQHADNS